MTIEHYKINDSCERRQYPRFRFSYPTTVHFKSKRISASAIDISEGGIGIILSEKLIAGHLLKFIVKYYPDDIKKQHTKIKARVIWCKDIGDGQYKAGLGNGEGT